jgi:hypothetical protein
MQVHMRTLGPIRAKHHAQSIANSAENMGLHVQAITKVPLQAELFMTDEA